MDQDPERLDPGGMISFPANVDLVNIENAAKLMKCSKRTVFYKIKKGILPHIKVNGALWFPLDDLMNQYK
jgi:excisionase family DNA binding protein